MIVVSDTSPLNYLVLIQCAELLPQIFGRVAAPPAVITEMLHPRAPMQVQKWAASPPSWLEVIAPKSVLSDLALGPGESAAIALAQELQADVLLIDERKGAAVASLQGLAVAGTLTVLDLAAERRLLQLNDAIDRLRHTTFRMPEVVVDEILRRDARRKSGDS